MQKLLIRSAAAIMMGFSSMVVAPHVAGAQDFEIEIDRDGPRLRLGDDRCDPRYEACRRNDDRRQARRSVCTEDRALDKAARMGVRRARIEDSGRRTIEVSGRTRSGERVYLTFGRAPNCPVYN